MHFNCCETQFAEAWRKVCERLAEAMFAFRAGEVRRKVRGRLAEAQNDGCEKTLVAEDGGSLA